MGTKLDMKNRDDAVRLTGIDAKREEKVKMARKFIYEDGHGVNSAAVERILEPTSTVPTRVSVCYLCISLRLHITIRIHSSIDFRATSTFRSCSWWT
jgi:hypothetical protein